MSMKRFNEMVATRGFHWAYAMYQPTPEEQEEEAKRLQDIGRQAALAFEKELWRQLFGESEAMRASLRDHCVTMHDDGTITVDAPTLDHAAIASR